MLDESKQINLETLSKKLENKKELESSKLIIRVVPRNCHCAVDGCCFKFILRTLCDPLSVGVFRQEIKNIVSGSKQASLRGTLDGVKHWSQLC